ncbi:alpha/beta hydrolase [Phenylobacterium sp.]|uniref:alpha/beta hydrolase n=1 Tax=Phenylobacterium sp. TaxID=1871053 RepID=UPI00374D1BE1
MNRRQAILGSAGMFAAGSGRAGAADPGRTLWRDNGGCFGVGAFPEFGKGFFGFDYSSFTVGPLRTAGARAWKMAGSLDGAAPPVEGLRVVDGRLLTDRRRFSPVPIERRRFEVQSGRTALSAEVAFVRDAPVRATVLMIYGSGPAPKEAFDPWAFWFLGEGLAVITYDKRGSGRSTGDWRLTSLEDLAADATAVLKSARSYGLKGPVFAWGASQGGWILPQLGAAKAVDGLIMHAGAATTPAGQILDQVVYSLKPYGFDQAEIDRATAYYALDVDVSRGRRNWSDIDAAYKAAVAAKADWILEPPVAADAPERTMIKVMADFDPAPYWRDNVQPVLALYGAKDWIVPAETNLPRLKQIVSPRTELTTRVIADANHLMFIAKSGERSEYAKLSRVSPDYFLEMRAWLSRHA